MKTKYLHNLPCISMNLSSEEIDFFVDTGFNGSLFIPQRILNKVNFKAIAETKYATADGRIGQSEVFEGVIDWLGKKVRVHVISTESEMCLLGMELLNLAKTTLDPSKNVLVITPSDM
jgi:clan AA aspartic protease